MGLIALGIVLLGAFVAIERRVAQPMPPLARVVLDRTRGGAFLALAVTGGVVFLTYYLQQSLALSRVLTGLAFLPAPRATAIGATQAATRLAQPFGARYTIPAAWRWPRPAWPSGLARRATSAVLPGLVVRSFGLGCVMGLSDRHGDYGVDPADPGVASATVKTMRHVGGWLGTALLTTLG